jgi:hypothetical protein
MQLVDRPNGTFTTLELERLAAYRAAVVAGFYTDWDGSAQGPDCDVLAWLPRGDAAHADGEAYPFTREERERLEACKAGMAAGRYSGDVLPSVPPAAETGATPDEATR